MNFLPYLSTNRFSVLVKPNAKKTEILGWDEGRQALRVAVAAPPEDNRANLELIKFFSRLLKKEVRIVSGLTSKKKILRVH
ncbi:YggU family protein [Candidatus Woesearchaeota archaeon]|nr:YggU family protein [Candidatus Woesearchaeota archaeon]